MVADAPNRPVVVFIDDEPAILRAFARILRSEPYDLRTFDDPEKALAWIERSEVDLVVTDERMPTMTGRDLLEEVCRRSPRTGCAIVTADPDSLVVSRNTGARIERLIAKPWNDQNLKGVIRSLLGRRG